MAINKTIDITSGNFTPVLIPQLGDKQWGTSTSTLLSKLVDAVNNAVKKSGDEIISGDKKIIGNLEIKGNTLFSVLPKATGDAATQSLDSNHLVRKSDLDAQSSEFGEDVRVRLMGDVSGDASSTNEAYTNAFLFYDSSSNMFVVGKTDRVPLYFIRADGDSAFAFRQGNIESLTIPDIGTYDTNPTDFRLYWSYGNSRIVLARDKTANDIYIGDVVSIVSSRYDSPIPDSKYRVQIDLSVGQAMGEVKKDLLNVAPPLGTIITVHDGFDVPVPDNYYWWFCDGTQTLPAPFRGTIPDFRAVAINNMREVKYYMRVR